MPNTISNQSSFQQIYQNFQKTSIMQRDKTLRTDGNQLYVSTKAHNIFAGKDKLAIRQQKYDGAYQAIQNALVRDVGQDAATKILSQVDRQIGNRDLSKGIRRSDLDLIHQQLQTVQREEGGLSTSSQTLAPVLDGEVQQDGFASAFVKDINRAVYTIGDNTFDHDGSGAKNSLVALFKDLPSKDAAKMIEAVSLLANQELTKLAHKDLLEEMGLVPANDYGTDSTRYQISRKENGDVQITAHHQAKFSNYVDPQTYGASPTGTGSHYALDISVVLKQDEVLSGNPIAHVTDSHYYYQINPQ